jgi:hypothetical protein
VHSNSLARNPIDIAPVLQQHAANARQPRLAVSMVRVPVVVRVRRELLRAAPVGGCQRLVPGAEDELRGIGGGVLFDV